MEKYNSFDVKPYTMRDFIIFEFLSWYGRKLKKSKIITKSNSPILMDLGFGSNYTNGWINIDFYLLPRIKFWKREAFVKMKPDIEHDLRYSLPCDNDIVDGIYCGHTLEHLVPNDARNLIKEMFRVLKPGAWLRINVPDLELFVKFYIGIKTDVNFDQFSSGCEAIFSLTQDYGHKSVWDHQSLSKLLQSIGFIYVKKVQFGVEGTDPRLIKEEYARKWSTLVIEAQKPLK